ncbi:MAG: DUF427 domain-containing protein [Pseudorhodoplanes sp.]|nr:DUF427 domain-containing protein [Pseudorhodoplanes sp.]
MLLPSSDHPITIAPHPRRVRVRFAGRTIADTTRALSLTEASYPPVLYIPREDADMGALKASAHRTYCPYKGDASHLTIEVNGRSAENAVWSCEQPFEAVAQIAGFIAFHPHKVDAIEQADLGA